MCLGFWKLKHQTKFLSTTKADVTQQKSGGFKKNFPWTLIKDPVWEKTKTFLVSPDLGPMKARLELNHQPCEGQSVKKQQIQFINGGWLGLKLNGPISNEVYIMDVYSGLRKCLNSSTRKGNKSSQTYTFLSDVQNYFKKMKNRMLKKTCFLCLK